MLLLVSSSLKHHAGEDDVMLWSQASLQQLELLRSRRPSELKNTGMSTFDCQMF